MSGLANGVISKVLNGEAEFWLGTCSKPADRPVVVSLPDRWAARKIAPPARGCYRLFFQLPALTHDRLWAIRFDRLSAQHSVYLNGTLVSAGGYEGGDSVRTIPVSRLVAVPPGMFQHGTNVLLVEVQHDNLSRAGLSFVEVGPEAQLRTRMGWDSFLSSALPQTVNLAAAGLSLLLLLIWGLRRKERAIGLFGLLFLLGSLRNYLYFSPVPLLSPLLSDGFLFCAQGWTFVLVNLFVFELLRDTRPRLCSWMVRGGLTLPLVTAFFLYTGQMQLLRRITYPFLIAGMLYPILILLRAGWRQRDWRFVALAFGLALVVVAGIHDFLLVVGILGVRAQFWMPLAMPAVFMVVSFMLVRRFVTAVANVESMHATLEQKVAERTSALVALNAAKSRFLAAASHDLRQPLHAIGITLGGLVLRASAEDRSAMMRLQEAIDGLDTQLKGVLDLSRIEAGSVNPQPCLVWLGPLLQAAVAAVEGQARAKGLTLRLRPTHMAVFSDPALLQSMVGNLIGNAVKYTRQGGVLVGCRYRAGRIRVEVWDTGEGIDKSEFDRVFDEFYQARTTQVPSGGFGLGLSIVARYAGMLGHRVTLASRQGTGSCFAVELPLCSEPEGPLAAEAVQDIAGNHILVLDNDEAVRQATGELLEAWGCTVISAATTGAALAMLEEQLRMPDLILCDYNLEQAGTGVAAVASLREVIGHAVPALIVTGDIQSASVADIKAAGLPLLQKPLSVDRLRAEIARIMAPVGRGGVEG